MNTGKIMSDLRDQKGWSQSELATKSGISRVMIGKYERGEAIPSIEVAKKIAQAFEVSLDYLAGEGVNASYNKEMVQRLDELESLPENEKQQIFQYMDLVIRDYKTKKAYIR